MLVYVRKGVKIYFGGVLDKVFLKDVAHLLGHNGKEMFELEQFKGLCETIPGLESVYFLHQVHGADGLVLSTKEQVGVVRSFTIDGDFLVTNLRGVGIGVMTADCLPIVFCDKKNLVVGVAHASWRGAAKGVGTKTVESMAKAFGTQVEDLRVFFGPSARPCCYKVSDNFIEQVGTCLQERVDRECILDIAKMALIKRGVGLYFDLPAFNMLLLEKKLGIKREAFDLTHNLCTICNRSFFSHRVNPDLGGRQMTVVCLL